MTWLQSAATVAVLLIVVPFLLYYYVRITAYAWTRGTHQALVQMGRDIFRGRSNDE